MFFSFLAGYLSGSVPYGLVLGKISGIGDIRKSGSGNIGATNMLRVGGKKLAILTLLLDGLKGYFPVLIAAQFDMNFSLAAAIGAFVGHLFPVWLRFRGGKGVAVAIGVSFALSAKLGFIICLAWVATALVSRYSSLAALVAFAFTPVVAHFIAGNLSVTSTMTLISIAVWFKHHENIHRLLQGKESRIGGKK
jgi:glycerol-3-phosphate acyltransferase PlsY